MEFDPKAVVAAFVAGTIAIDTNLATTAIQELYDGLRSLLQRRLTPVSEGRERLNALTSNSTNMELQSAVETMLADATLQTITGVEDHELQRLAASLLQQIAAEEEALNRQVVQVDQPAVARGAGTPAEPQPPRGTPLRAGSLRQHQTTVDPNLQRAAAQAVATQSPLVPRSSAAETEEVNLVDLVGQLNDPSVSVPGLNIIRQLDTFFTATAAAHEVATIAEHPNIVTVEMAQPLSPTLAVSVAEIGATQAQLQIQWSTGSDIPDGRDVIIGIVDRGCDFAHDNFRHSDGSTRILSIWHQDSSAREGTSPAGFAYGREHDRTAIDAALQTCTPYESLGYHPGIGSHGTHVTDIAAGNGRATGNPGVAPAADIIFVHVGSGGGREGNAVGTARNLMEAADYIFRKADELGKPAVINISLGTHSGPHDGSTTAERWFDQLLQTPNRAIVISAGNSWRHRAHAMGVVEPDAPARLPWFIQADDPTSNEVEIWYGAAHRLELTLYDPVGDLLATVPRGHSQSVCNEDRAEVISIIHNAYDKRNGDHQISLLLDKSLAPTESGPAQWQIELRSVDGDRVPFHAWIERDDVKPGNLSYFHPQVVCANYTLGSISCGRDTITVGSYRAGESDRSISASSSAGPTRDGRQKPELSAPGEYLATPQEQKGVLAAESGTNGAMRKAGTSMAAPHVAGLIALLLQRADMPLTIEQIRSRLFDTVRNDPPADGTWHPQYGFGRVDATAIFHHQ